MQTCLAYPIAVNQSAAAILQGSADKGADTGMARLRFVRIALVLPILRALRLDYERNSAGSRLFDQLRALFTCRLVILRSCATRRKRRALTVGRTERRPGQIGVGIFSDSLCAQKPVGIQRDNCPVRIGHQTPCIVAQSAACALRRQTIRIIRQRFLRKRLPRIAGNGAGEVRARRNLTTGSSSASDEGLPVSLGSADVSFRKRKWAARDVRRDWHRPSPAPASWGRVPRRWRGCGSGRW